MSPDRAGPQADPHPFRVFCPSCGADSDTEGQDFTVDTPAFVPHGDLMLSEIGCLTCKEKFDICFWPVDHESLSRSLVAGGDPLHSADPQILAVLDRYERLVEASRREWEGYYERGWDKEVGQHGMDLSQEYVAPQTTRLTAANARVLGACRGLRKAVSGHPGEDPVAILQLGPFNCALTLELAPGPPLPYNLHLSVSHSLLLGTLNDLEATFLVSLFFSPEERSSLLREEGQHAPVTHFRLPCTSSDLDRASDLPCS
jgi:hypothetical protein